MNGKFNPSITVLLHVRITCSTSETVFTIITKNINNNITCA